METRILAGVLQSDTHQRLTVGEEALEYFKKDCHKPKDFPELERLVGGLAAWLSSSNFKVVVAAVDVLSVLVVRLKEKFRPHIPTVLPALKERLGDAKDQVREQCQAFVQLLMRETTPTPQLLLEQILEVGLAHKNWRVKEQSLVCLTRTLNYFGSGQVSVSKFMGSICSLIGDANSQVRSSAMETIVEVYRHVGVKVRIDLSRRGLASSRMTVLSAKFDAIDATSNTVHSTNERDGGGTEDDRESVSSCGSSASARTFGSAKSAPTRSSRPHSALAGGGGRSSGSVGGVDKEVFIKAFSDTPRLNLFTTHDVEKRVAGIDATLQDIKNNWEERVTALKELRSVAKNEALDHAHLVGQLKQLETAMLLSLKDLRSQITREACVTISYIATVLGSDVAAFAEVVMPQLIALLPNSAKVMANSASICIKFIIEYAPTHRLLQPLGNGISAKSPITRKQCAEFLVHMLSQWETVVLDRATTLIEGLLRRGLSDSDPTARKHTRRAYWAYHGHFPSNAQLLFDSLDTSVQKHINDERVAMERHSNGAPPTASLSSNSLHPPLSRKKRPLPSHAHSDADLTVSAVDVSPTHTLPPSLRLSRPTLRSPARPRRKPGPPDVRLPIRPASSMGSLVGPPSSPARPSSRSGRPALRPASRSGLSKTADGLGPSANKPRPLPQRTTSRNAQHSPSQSPLSSPTRKVFSQKTATPLTKEALHKIYGGGSHDQESDDAGSVTSERSTFSFSSEMSVNPYSKYPNPITDLNQLVAMCSSQQWAERRDGMAQLHMLLESPRPFSHSDMQKVKTVFKRMLSEPHIKVYGMFLDTLSQFIEEHREYLDDWLFLLLLRLLHKQGTDMLSSVHFKLTLVLEHVRKSFEPEAQLSALWRIVSDQTQPMNPKVRIGWLEFFLELLPALESADFRDTSETRAAVSKLLQFTTEPKSAEVRRSSQKCVVGLFELNPATFTLMLRNISKPLQESANRILRGHVADMSSSSGEESDRETTPTSSPSRATPTSRVRRKPTAADMKTPLTNSRRPPPSSSTTPRPGAAVNHLPPSGARGMRGARTISSSSPDILREGASEPLSERRPRSRIPTPRSIGGQRSIPRRAESTTPYSTRPLPPSSSVSRSQQQQQQRRPVPPRAQSVDPDRMARLLQRPSSSRSDYTPDCYQNGEEETPGLGIAQHFSFSDLPHLDFGSPDEEEAAEHDEFAEKDHFALVLKDLQTASHSKARSTALQTLLTLCKESPQKCKWEEHFNTTVLRLIELVEDEEAGVRVYSLRVLREMLKTQADKLTDFAEITTLKVLKAFVDGDVSVSQVAEDVFPQLAPALPSQSALSLLAPMAAREKYPMLLGTVKLLTRVVALAEPSYLEGRLGDIVPGVVRSYCHSESSVRKASVFCLVALHSKVGSAVQPHLTKLSSSQRKLLDLYIKRSKEQVSRVNGPSPR